MKVESNFTFIARMGFIVGFTTWRCFRMLSDRKVITRKWIIAIKEQWTMRRYFTFYKQLQKGWDWRKNSLLLPKTPFPGQKESHNAPPSPPPFFNVDTLHLNAKWRSKHLCLGEKGGGDALTWMTRTVRLLTVSIKKKKKTVSVLTLFASACSSSRAVFLLQKLQFILGNKMAAILEEFGRFLYNIAGCNWVKRH